MDQNQSNSGTACDPDMWKKLQEMTNGTGLGIVPKHPAPLPCPTCGRCPTCGKGVRYSITYGYPGYYYHY